MSAIDFSGQWLGSAGTESFGRVIFDVDYVEGRFQGVAFVFSKSDVFPHIALPMDFDDLDSQVVPNVPVHHFHAELPLSQQESSTKFPNAALPVSINIAIKLIAENVISVTVEIPDVGGHEVTLVRTVMPELSKVLADSEVTTWRKFLGSGPIKLLAFGALH